MLEWAGFILRDRSESLAAEIKLGQLKKLHPKDIFTSDLWIYEYYLIWQKAYIIFYGKNVIKLSWIIQVDLKSLYKCPYKRVREPSVTDTQERQQCDPKGRLEDVVIKKNDNSYQNLEETKNGFYPSLRKYVPADILILDLPPELWE